MSWNENLAKEIAKGIVATGIEGAYDSVAQSTAYSYPSIGVSQWEGYRADRLLSCIRGGERFRERSYSDIVYSGDLPALKALLDSEEGRAAQLELLSSDCMDYVAALQTVPMLDDTRCLIYAGMWCPTSTVVVTAFLKHRQRWGYNLRSLHVLRDLFADQYYKAADVGEMYHAGYANRAENTYQYVAGIDLTTPYGVPAYGQAGNGR